MDRLPQEITDSIVEAFVQDLGKAPPTRLSKYRTVSKNWRRAIERRLFTKIDGIASGSFQLSFFKNILAGEGNRHRRESVRSFTYTTYLAFRGQQDMLDFVRESQLRLLDEFSQLFTVINDIWPTDQGTNSTSPQPLALTVSIVGIGHWKSEYDESTFTSHPQAAASLPLTPAIISLEIVFDQAWNKGRRPRRFKQSGGGNQVPPSWILQPLMAKLPSVGKLSYEMFNFLGQEQFWDRLFTDTFKFLSGPMTANLTELYLHIGPFGLNTFNQTPSELWVSMMARNSDEDDHNPRFNAALRQLSQQLSVLHVSGLFAVHPELFYPKELAKQHDRVQEARLREQSVGRGSTIDRFLLREPQELNHLAVSLTRGMLCMPKLESVEIAFRVMVNPQKLAVGLYRRGDYDLPGRCERIRYQRKWLAEALEVLDTSSTGDSHEEGDSGAHFYTCYLLNDVELYENDALRSEISDEVEENLVELRRRLRGVGLSRFPYW
ncbi:hypothetical protein NEUTE1DRAFT_101282 [Neurospora tetrasperma FGSC 2508]|uniref:Uncharacterized protein n=1 Tax=Neurospora tetrasperma (strain FGSC 2508 / ATCC MYA-4615 / P0657) TaxID=510951 RepID=F8MLN8_NEUT8|nr:uncharacterized protein NEUTE1DRAFT_101282 [Neurospora tetrasperma FGSC 2508]EGO58457.1 hypothetical protein NEUTE1DRAFT_101282 [Neurospora tetrasperma FGSC 2508]EGZ71209.1 hypothetical protein NEUTE2DRAFT_128606 [Neurospora tetrasperma FGSC 2509]